MQVIQTPTGPVSGATPTADAVKGHLESGMAFHSMLQMDDGHFPGDYGGPMFLLPGLLIACYVTGSLDKVFSPVHKEEMLRYFCNHQNEDGGFGLHIEGQSTMFGTGLWYAALRPDQEIHRILRVIKNTLWPSDLRSPEAHAAMSL